MDLLEARPSVCCRIWRCLAEGQPAAEDVDELLKFLFGLLLPQDCSGTGKSLIADEDVTCILKECFPTLDPSLLSADGYLCLKVIMLKVRRLPGRDQLGDVMSPIV